MDNKREKSPDKKKKGAGGKSKPKATGEAKKPKANEGASVQSNANDISGFGAS